MWFVLPRTPVFSPLTPPQIFSRERRLGAICNKLTMPWPVRWRRRGVSRVDHPLGIPGYFPQMAIRILKVAGVPAPPRLLGWLHDDGARVARLLYDRIDFPLKAMDAFGEIIAEIDEHNVEECIDCGEDFSRVEYVRYFNKCQHCCENGQE